MAEYIQLAYCKYDGKQQSGIFEAPAFAVSTGDKVMNGKGEMMTVVAETNCSPESDEAKFIKAVFGVDTFERLASHICMYEYIYEEERAS